MITRNYKRKVINSKHLYNIDARSYLMSVYIRHTHGSINKDESIQ